MTPRVREQIKAAKFQTRVLRKIVVQKDGPLHWLWTGTKYSDKYGFYQYGITQRENVRKPVHRVVWEWHNGPIPEGGMLTNCCGNTLCVNPKHWRLVDHWSHARNRKRGVEQ